MLDYSKQFAIFVNSIKENKDIVELSDDIVNELADIKELERFSDDIKTIAIVAEENPDIVFSSVKLKMKKILNALVANKKNPKICKAIAIFGFATIRKPLDEFKAAYHQQELQFNAKNKIVKEKG